MKRIKLAIMLIMVCVLFTGCNNSNSGTHDELITTEIESTTEHTSEAEVESSTEVQSTEELVEETSFVSKEINEEDPEEVIKEYVRCLGHDWDRVANFHESATVEGWIEFFNNEIHRSENVGILNVNNAELVDYIEVSFDDVKSYLSWPYDSYEGREVKAYVVLIDYSVNQPDPYFYDNGLSYNLYTLVKEDGLWKIRESLNIYEEELAEMGYVLGE